MNPRNRRSELLTLESVQKRDALIGTAIERLTVLYKQTADRIGKRVLSYSVADGSKITMAKLSSLLDAVYSDLTLLRTQQETLLLSDLNRVIAIGKNALSGIHSLADPLRSNDPAVQMILDYVTRWTGLDGLKLSDRLWRMDEHTMEVVRDHIQMAVIRGESAEQALMRAMQIGVPPELPDRQAVNAARPDAINTGLRDLMIGDGENGGGSLAQALRVFRTEINRAYGESYMQSAFEIEGVVGVRFCLSPNHPRVDICDTHATADEFNLGAGVYPTREDCPWPAHPNTMSYVMAVFDKEW